MTSSYPDLNLLIDGEWIAPVVDSSIPVINPADETVLGLLPRASDEDVITAIDAAWRAFREWRHTSPNARAQILRKMARYLLEKKEDLARIITLELGKPLTESYVEVEKASEHFLWAAEETRRLYGRVIPADSRYTSQTVSSEPIGPIAAFSGWNAPAITPSRKIAGALGAGCTVVIKPAEETPATALFLARGLQECGLPRGVLNMVFGDPARISRQLLESDKIKGVTFTGSTEIGKEVARQASVTLKRVVLELGGHAPVLVFRDADPVEAARKLAQAKFRNAGQICTSPTRILVHSSIAADFRANFTDYAKSLKVGNGLDRGVTMGPLANSRRLDAMERMVSDALDQGGELLTGGSRIGAVGYFFEPTVVAGFDRSWRAANVEPFGPLALLAEFENDEEALEEANRLPAGLAAYVFTNNAKTIRRVSDEIESGALCINHCLHSIPEAPFGGFKDSGLGKEGGVEGLAEFLRYKYVTQV